MQQKKYNNNSAANEALIKYIKNGSYKHIQTTIDLGADINFKMDDKSLLHHLVISNDSKSILILLIFQVSIDSIEDPYGMPAIFYALNLGNQGVFNLLYKSGANLAIIDNRGYNLVIHAVLSDNIKIIVPLGLSDEYFNHKDNTGKTPLHHAALNKRYEIMDFLIKRKVHLNEIDEEGNTAMIYAVQNNFVKGMKLLKYAGADLDVVNDVGHSALSLCFFAKSIRRFNLLLDNKSENRNSANPNIIYKGYKLLQIAASQPRCKAHRYASHGIFLIKYGADIYFDNVPSSSFYIKDCNPENISKCEFLKVKRQLQELIFANLKNIIISTDYKKIIHAINEDSDEMINKLLNLDELINDLTNNLWIVNSKNKNGNTLMHIIALSVSSNSQILALTLAKILVNDLGADITLINNKGQTPYDIICSRNNINVSDLKRYLSGDILQDLIPFYQSLYSRGDVNEKVQSKSL